MQQTEETIPRHTEDLQEIITRVPSWILRWGITLFFAILLMVVGIAVLVRYPDTVKAALKIESLANARPVSAPVAGRVIKVLVKPGDKVKAGQWLATVAGGTDVASGYNLTAPQDGHVAFISIIVPGYFLHAGQEVFTVHPANEAFYGVMQIPQNSMSKIRTGQQVLIRLRNYPAEDGGGLKGTVTNIADEPGSAGFFMVRVALGTAGTKLPVNLKTWMTADAEIITEDISVESRIYRSIMKGLQ